MDFLLANWMLILVALISGSMLLAPMVTGGGGAGISPAAAVQLINREKAVVIDVCETAEYQAGHVGGAKSIPLAELEAKLPAVVKNKATPLVLVCASGMRSGRAVAAAKKLGYDNAQSLAGGLKSWREANLPIEKA
ncbi:rhodanese-like domain-containing protein [Ottowia testudinis]|uniref:Rhodanese-like domain-containing protein n=1 Tax=Ottowia testudinis TaxID=2816950 RepID=A0A975CGL7_9BURK|nr:rhodanese-like domain-containing protein [Ottowia testudinis]QTD44726.1 rhodanese-like domain-containing protein [Ottowia testudinis]